MKSILLTLSLVMFIFVLVAQETDTSKNKNTEYYYGELGFEKEQKFVVTRYDGFEYIGEILSDDGREILMKTKTLGQIYIPKFEVKSIVKVMDKKTIVYSDYEPTGPFTTRYTFTTNALPIKKGENYSMLNLYGPEAHLALSDRLNMGLMSSWIASPLVLATKYSFSSDVSKVNFSFGTLLGTSGYLNSFKGYGGIHWLNLTFGSRKNNLTFSGGYAYLQAGIIDEEPQAGTYTENEYQNLIAQKSSKYQKMTQGPVFSVAGIFKIGAKSGFIFDSMIGYFNFEKVDAEMQFSDGQETVYIVTRTKNAYTTALLLMPGVRFQSTDRKAFQISIAGISLFGDAEASFPIPMCTWFYKF